MDLFLYPCNHIYTGCLAGSRVPSPFDSCNTCLCGEDGSIEGCTRILCLEGTSLNVKVLRFILILLLFANISFNIVIILEDVCKVEGENCGLQPVHPAIDHGTCCLGSECTYSNGLGSIGTCTIGI